MSDEVVIRFIWSNLRMSRVVLRTTLNFKGVTFYTDITTLNVLKENFLHDICFQCLHKMSRSERSNQNVFISAQTYVLFTHFIKRCLQKFHPQNMQHQCKGKLFSMLFFLEKNNAIPDASPNFMFVSVKNAIGWKTWLGIFMRGQKSPRANDARPPISMKWQDCRTLKYENPI